MKTRQFILILILLIIIIVELWVLLSRTKPLTRQIKEPKDDKVRLSKFESLILPIIMVAITLGVIILVIVKKEGL